MEREAPPVYRKYLPDNLLKAKILKNLHEVLEESDLITLEKSFNKAPKGLKINELRMLLFQTAKVQFENDEFQVLFMKIDYDSNGYVNWSEFISYLMISFEEGDIRAERTPLEMPIVGYPRVIKSNHRAPVARIAFCPAVLADRSTSWINGSYLTMSKDGCINYWSMDFVLNRTVYSQCTILKIQPTWVTDMIVMPDVSVVCTSSTERDLRFYDTSAKKFELRILLYSLEYAVYSMSYYYNKNDEESKLILGDQGGHVRIIFISTERRGPFKSEPGFLLRQVRWEKFSKNSNLIPHMRVAEFRHIHTDWVRQVAYYPNLNCFLSVATCPKQAMYMSDMSQKSIYSFRVQMGILCFDFLDSIHLIVTGSPDCLIRLWNPFVPNRPTAILTGHHNSVVGLVLQDEGRRLFSLSKDKCIKIWDLTAQTCIQTYLQLPNDLGERSDFTIYYNSNTREVFIGSMKIAVVTVYGELNPEETDGYTHIESVSVALYNPLFKIVLTCGTESTFITWDPFTGTRLIVVKHAHIKMVRGEVVPIEITAATFNPGWHLVLTGARDGTLKIWNFNTGNCIRNMMIDYNCEVTTVMWIESRIFAVGWNKHVTEFPDSYSGTECKKWDIRHTDDILSADLRVPQSLVTSSYKGELVFWRLETGQPYKRINVANPTGRIAIDYMHKVKPNDSHQMRDSTGSTVSMTSTVATIRQKSSRASRGSNVSRMTPGKDSRLFSIGLGEKRLALPSEPITLQALEARARRISVVDTPFESIPLRSLAVHCILFLQNRPMHPAVGSLVVAVDNGIIQLYSHHQSGGFIKSFDAIHTHGDYVMAMTSDVNNEFLFTGHKVGYIKIWLISNYAINEEKKIFMPKYRLMFPFLWEDVLLLRAKRAVRKQPLPILCNSFRAHLFPVTGITYINECQVFCSCSSDHSARLFTIGGKYLGTLGTFLPWTDLPTYGPPPENIECKIPPDIKRVASYTTLKVLNGGKAPRTRKQKPPEEHRELNKEEREKGVYGKPVDVAAVSNLLKLPERTKKTFNNITLDNSLAMIPIYTHLETSTLATDVCSIPIPAALAENKS